MDSWRELMNPRDIGKLMDTPDYAAWKGLRDAVDSRYVALCMPRVLSRLPYGAKSEPVEEFAFEEDTDGHNGEKYGWMNAAYAMATNVNRAFKEYGWTVRIRGVESGGEVINLPTHTFPTDDGGVDLKCPTEIAITDRREARTVEGRPHLDRPSQEHRQGGLHRRAVGLQAEDYMDKAEATASDNLSARIPYMFAVSRFAHYLKCMVRDKIGSTKEKDQLENWLNDWIILYVDGDPEELERGDQGAQAAGGGQGHRRPERGEPGLLLRQRLSASALPARRHGYRHEPRVEPAAGEDVKAETSSLVSRAGRATLRGSCRAGRVRTFRAWCDWLDFVKSRR